MRKEHSLTLGEIGQGCADFDEIDRPARLPTRKEISRTAFGILFFLGAGLAIIWLGALMR
jgi:hypothetical protein